jgi:hypothetical protein
MTRRFSLYRRGTKEDARIGFWVQFFGSWLRREKCQNKNLSNRFVWIGRFVGEKIKEGI